MGKMLELYKAVAERETGFWIDLPVVTGQLVPRDEWISLMEADPSHFQMARLTAEELTGCSIDDGDAIECAVLLTWSDELSQ
jgi:hypothetical protein